MKRQLKVPTSQITRTEFQKLQCLWDAKLADSGFIDIEAGQDLSEIPGATTFRKFTKEGGHGMEVALTVRRHEVKALSDTENATVWALVANAAHELPIDEKTRNLLVDFANCGSIEDAAARAGVSRWAMTRLIRRLCRAIDVDYQRLLSSPCPRRPEELHPPGPVKQYTRREIRALERERRANGR